MLPPFIAPQLATPRENVPKGADWVHEIKFDGNRMLGYLEAGGARLLSRKTLDWSGRFGQVAEALRSLRAKEAVVDGEVCVLDDRGRSDFQALRALVDDGRPARLSYLVFDLLWLDGMDLRALPLLKRKARLEKIVPKRNAVIQYVEHFRGDAVKFFVGICESGLGGIVSKHANARYESGRSTAWVTVKCVDAKEFFVGGYVPSQRRSYFKSLIVGELGPDGLVYRGLVGSGFTETLGRKIAGMLTPLAVEEPPFAKIPWELRGRAKWVRPQYVVQVRFTEITRDGVLRHPRFVRLRDASEPGVGEHLRSRTIEDRKRKQRRRPRSPAPEPDRPALLDALRKSVGKGVPRRPKPRRRLSAS